MQSTFFFDKANLAEALASMAKLLPRLPFPRISEQLDGDGVIHLPQIGGDNNLPVQEHPRVIVERLRPFERRLLPDTWLVAYYGHQERCQRNAQLLRLYPLCWSEGPAGLDNIDGTVAGALLMSIKPLPGALRKELMRRCLTNWWGAFFAINGLVMADEAEGLLRCICNDPRLVAGLWRLNQYYAEPLIPLTMGRHDLWSATIALAQPLGDLWLGRACIQAEHHGLAAVTALVLQPTAPASEKNKWIRRLQTGHPRLAYLAVRWARFTWPRDWDHLRDELKVRACGDAWTWFHWYRDIQPEPDIVDEALRQNEVSVLWQAELVDHVKNNGQYLKRRMMGGHPDDREARLTLGWLQRRPEHRP